MVSSAKRWKKGVVYTGPGERNVALHGIDGIAPPGETCGICLGKRHSRSYVHECVSAFDD